MRQGFKMFLGLGLTALLSAAGVFIVNMGVVGNIDAGTTKIGLYGLLTIGLATTSLGLFALLASSKNR